MNNLTEEHINELRQKSFIFQEQRNAQMNVPERNHKKFKSQNKMLLCM